MDIPIIKNNSKFILFSVIVTLITIVTIFIINIVPPNEKPIDYEVKVLDKCYLTLHNLIWIRNWNDSFRETDVKTFVYSQTKPFLIELLNNVTDDCLCCPSNYNQHLNFQ